MSELVGQCFERPDVVVVRQSHVPDEPTASQPHFVHLGRDISSRVTSLLPRQERQKNTARTAANLLFTPWRFEVMLRDMTGMKHYIRLGQAVLTSEVVEGLAIVAINHPDINGDEGTNFHTISLVAQHDTDGSEHLAAVWSTALEADVTFIAAMHWHMRQSVPQALTIGCFATYDQQVGVYRSVAMRSPLSWFDQSPLETPNPVAVGDMEHQKSITWVDNRDAHL